MADLRYVTYCGLHCGLCAQRGRIPRQAKALRESMAKEGFEYWGGSIPGFREFWIFLTDLSDPDKGCPGCRQGGGPDFCEIRKCARRRGIELCPLCADYPCQIIRDLANVYPTLLADGKRIQEIGIERWIPEQEERAQTGFAYADIRCQPGKEKEE
ncbi:MAG: DUF3795 domain-containing protein [bacterium]